MPQKAANHLQSTFSGWMLLNYNKPVQVSSTLGGYQASLVVDEDIKLIGLLKLEMQANGFKPI